MSRNIAIASRSGSTAVREKNAYYGHSRSFIDKLLAEDDPTWIEAQKKTIKLVHEMASDLDDEETLIVMLGLEKVSW